jgi:hypothetical protein
MYEAGIVTYMVFNIWILFFGGADKIENTLLGYLEFGLPDDKAWAIRVMAWISLALGSAVLLINAVKA